ncbi:hypothetical protein NliqN6_4187 [Naganishia liquefaciens]|uniref:Uncharacterized protein n=1 Tax=Naganishia liquefaciens TaxID=104408 RepID=A0A8H3TV30_9TREE|nr:hypothetical protein NliqN6_4187 [Naganishia liquefaciens]
MNGLPGIIEEAEDFKIERQSAEGRRGSEVVLIREIPVAWSQTTTRKYLLPPASLPGGISTANKSLAALNSANLSLSSTSTLKDDAHSRKAWSRPPKLGHQPSFASSSSSRSSRSSRLSLRRLTSWASRTSLSSSSISSPPTTESSSANTKNPPGPQAPALQRLLDGEHSTKITMALVALKLYGWLQRKAGWDEHEPPVQVLINSEIVVPSDWPEPLKRRYGYSDCSDKTRRCKGKASKRRRL